jgi:hypothetical protein
VEALRRVLKKYMGTHGTLHPLREMPTLQAGVEERSANVSAVWTWLGHHNLTNPDAAALFGDVRLTSVRLSHEQTADRIWERLGTSSSYQRLEPREREALERDTRDLIEQLGGTVRSSDLAILVTASRSNGWAALARWRRRARCSRHGRVCSRLKA